MPILLKNCYIEKSIFHEFKSLPNNGVSIHDWVSSEKAWKDILKKLKNVCIEQKKEKSKQMPDAEPVRFLDRGFSIERMNPTIYKVAWSPDRKYVATGDNKQQVLIWDTNPDKADFNPKSFKKAELVDLLEKEFHKGIVKGLAWSPSGKRLASAGTDQKYGSL
jgi:WD40 repeat protein